MHRSSKLMLFGLGLFLLAVAIAPPQSQSSGGGPAVVVSNTPLPVQGTVGVNNLPAVQSVSGTVAVSNLPSDQTVNGTVNVASLPAVQLSGSSSVSVANSLIAPVPVLHAEALNSFTATGNCSFNSNVQCPAFSFYAVPSGKIAVIEFISAHCTMDSGATLSYIQFSDQTGFNVYGTPSAPVVSFLGGVDVTFSQSVKGYANSTIHNGDTLNFSFIASTSQTTYGDGCVGTVSGYLVSAQ